MTNRVEMNKPRGGSLVSVDSDQVELYKAKGYTIPEPEAKEPDFVELTQPPVSDLISKIVVVINKLPPEAFSKSTGKPGVKAIEAELGQNIVAAQRDEAWAVCQL